MIRATIACGSCKQEQVIEYDDTFTEEMVRDHLSLMNGTSRHFVYPPDPGDPMFSSVCCQAEIMFRIETP